MNVSNVGCALKMSHVHNVLKTFMFEFFVKANCTDFCVFVCINIEMEKTTPNCKGCKAFNKWLANK